MAKPTRFRATKRSRHSKLNFKRSWRYFYYRIVRLRDSPRAIARGLAAGVFAGFFPLLGVQMLSGVLLATLVRGNKFVAAAGTWISPPFAEVAIYAVNFKVGQWLLNWDNKSTTNLNLQSWEQLKASGSEIIITLFVGCFVMGSICAFISYFLGLWLVKRVGTRRRLR